MLLQIKSVVTWEQKGHKMIPDGKRPDGAAQKKKRPDGTAQEKKRPDRAAQEKKACGKEDSL